MGEETLSSPEVEPTHSPQPVLLLLPLILMLGVIAWLWTTGGGLRVAAETGHESLIVERTIITVGNIELVLSNNGPEPLTIAQASINGALWPVTVLPEVILSPYSRATLNFNFEWIEGQPYRIVIYTGRGHAFTFEIPAATILPRPIDAILPTLSLLGLEIGLLPVFVGLCWLPALRRLGRQGQVFLLTSAGGLMFFLAVRLLGLAMAQLPQVVGPFGGWGWLGFGASGSFALLLGLIARQKQPLAVLYLVALGIGLFNLGHALALSLAYTLAQLTLTAALIAGLSVLAIGQGWALAGLSLPAPLNRGPLLLIGFVAGFPALLGAWIGGFPASPTQAVLTMAIGFGALLAVVYEIGRTLQQATAQNPMPLTICGGLLVSIALISVTAVLIP